MWGKPAISMNYLSSKVECYTTLFHILVRKSKVEKNFIFNSEIFQVLPVSFETPPALQSKIPQLAVITFT